MATFWGGGPTPRQNCGVLVGVIANILNAITHCADIIDGNYSIYVYM